VVERMVREHRWPYQRDGNEQITLAVRGKWTDYQGSFVWMPGVEALHLALAFDLTQPDHCRPELRRLTSMINEQLWIGHFDQWSGESLVMYRNALVLAGAQVPSVRQCEALLGAACRICERYHPAYQFVVWAGEGAEAALTAASFETAGNA
jgi:hypothetical protein